MYAILAFVSLVPLGAYFLARRLDEAGTSRRITALIAIALFGIGLFPASPYITSRGVGSGEAYNYSLALADAVIQMRAGHVPMAGQTEYAFNGRIHPLRNAPMLFFYAGALDALTARKLTFWQLQNLTLALSIVASAFSCYGALRWATACHRGLALLLSLFYVWSPGLLAASTINLFMTLHAAVLVPIAIAGCVRHVLRPALINDVIFAAALAAAWLAHPPVAAWLSLPLVALRVVILWFDPSWQRRAGLFGAGVLGLLLAGFVFVSVRSLNADLSLFTSAETEHDEFVSAVVSNLKRAFPASVLPASFHADALGDLQFGYAGWLSLFAAVAGFIFVRKPSDNTTVRQGVGLTLILSVALLVTLALPIPGLTGWLWNQVPGALATLTNIWPMQRVYVVAMGLVIFAVALLTPLQRFTAPRARASLFIFAGVAALWTGSETWKFVRRGLALMWSSDATEHALLLSNLNLTITSYAFFVVPQTFMHGVMDPLLEFRLLATDGSEVASQLSAGRAQGATVLSGEITRKAPDRPVRVGPNDHFTMQPGKRYFVNFDFSIPPIEGAVDIAGQYLRRHYLLPESGRERGFGMKPGNSHTLSVWTSSNAPETVELRFIASTWPPGHESALKVGTFSVQELDPATLPVKVESYLPLRLIVDAPTDECFVSTPRGYIPGYEAAVNGRPARAIRSPQGQVMMQVPKGRSEVELTYVGPPELRLALWTSGIAWLGLGLWAGGTLAGVDWRRRTQPLRHVGAAGVLGVWRFKWPLLIGATALTAVLVYRYHRNAYLDSAGPIRITFLLPQKDKGRSQPILVTGKTGAGAIIFLKYLDDTHIKLGADIWGALYESETLRVDYFQPHDLVVNASGLYPLDHPRVKALSPQTREELRQNFTVEFDGRTVIQHQGSAYDSSVQQVTIGETRIGGSLVEPRFTGEVIRVKRLPYPSPLVLAHDQTINLELKFPRNRSGGSEPILSAGSGPEQAVLAVNYLPGDKFRFWYQSPGGPLAASPEFLMQAQKTYRMNVVFGRLRESGLLQVSAELDGVPLFSAPTMDRMRGPLTLFSGWTKSVITGLEARFTGPLLKARLDTPGPRPIGAGETGPIRLVLRLPHDKIGFSEPLLTTGRAGSGDFAFISYLDAGHVRFGVDHWGKGGAQSDPIAVDYTIPHEIELSFSSLFPTEADSRWQKISPEARERASNEMTVKLDGDTVLRAEIKGHPTQPAEITPGENRIGGSSSSPKFSGTLFSAERVGLPQ